jgi:hypothetical protein
MSSALPSSPNSNTSNANLLPQVQQPAAADVTPRYGCRRWEMAAVTRSTAWPANRRV